MSTDAPINPVTNQPTSLKRRIEQQENTLNKRLNLDSDQLTLLEGRMTDISKMMFEIQDKLGKHLDGKVIIDLESKQRH